MAERKPGHRTAAAWSTVGGGHVQKWKVVTGLFRGSESESVAVATTGKRTTLAMIVAVMEITFSKVEGEYAVNAAIKKVKMKVLMNMAEQMIENSDEADCNEHRYLFEHC